MKGITPFLWFDEQAEEAAKHYVSIFSSLGSDDSQITDITRYGEAGAQAAGRPEGSIMTVAFRLNGHDPNSKQGAAKKRLSDYILRRAKIADPLKKTPYYLRRFGILHRDGSPRGKKARHA